MLKPDKKEDFYISDFLEELFNPVIEEYNKINSTNFHILNLGCFSFKKEIFIVHNNVWGNNHFIIKQEEDTAILSFFYSIIRSDFTAINNVGLNINHFYGPIKINLLDINATNIKCLINFISEHITVMNDYLQNLSNNNIDISETILNIVNVYKNNMHAFSSNNSLIAIDIKSIVTINNDEMINDEMIDFCSIKFCSIKYDYNIKILDPKINTAGIELLPPEFDDSS